MGQTAVDFQVNRHGVLFAGVHLLVDVRDAENLDNIKSIEEMLKLAACDAGATVLHSYMHQFEPHGVSGVVVLSESHISIHTWPERNYAAIDVFMCGDCDPYRTIERMKEFFNTTNITISEVRRGVEV